MPPISVSCLTCGKSFKTWPSRIKKGHGKYCSRECKRLGMVTQVTLTCEWCKQEFSTFASFAAKGQKYCSVPCRAHSKSTPGTDRGWITKACEYCDSPFRTKIAHSKRQKAKFCSRECFHRQRAVDSYVSVDCAECAQPVRVERSQIKPYNNTFCNWSCYTAFQTQRVACTCEVCGKDFEVRPSARNRGGGRFCSNRCFADWNTGENHHLWAGGENQYQRRKAKPGTHSRADIDALWRIQRGRCVFCTVDLRETGFHRDHIIPLARGGTHFCGNIQLTCPTCNIAKNQKLPVEFRREMQRHKSATGGDLATPPPARTEELRGHRPQSSSPAPA